MLEIVHDYFTSMKQSVDTVWKEQARRQMRSKTQARQKAEERNLQKLQKQQEALKQEILKSITGESPLDTDTLQSMLCENKAAIKACEDALVECRRERENEEAKLDYLSSQYKNISDWAEVFDDASIEEKKMILAKIIERIEVDRHYHLTVHFFVTLSDFEVSGTDVTIVEAEDCRETKVG